MVNDKIERENFFKLIYKGEKRRNPSKEIYGNCLLYTSDAADEDSSV